MIISHTAQETRLEFSPFSGVKLGHFITCVNSRENHGIITGSIDQVKLGARKLVNITGNIDPVKLGARKLVNITGNIDPVKLGARKLVNNTGNIHPV